jgi:hypothetical protein
MLLPIPAMLLLECLVLKEGRQRAQWLDRECGGVMKEHGEEGEVQGGGGGRFSRGMSARQRLCVYA